MRRTVVMLAIAGAALWHPATAAAQDNPFSSCHSQNADLRSASSTPEPIPDRPGALLYTLTGSPVVIVCDDTTLEADLIKYESDTRLIHAFGNVLFQQADLRISAEHAEIDGNTKLGTFYVATGSARLLQNPQKVEKSQFGALEPDVLFQGEEISRVAPKTYRIKNGSFTTCAQPTPRWEMSTLGATITLDKSAFLRNVVFKVKNVPLMYFPAIYYPINKEDRSTGFLMPSYGSSTVGGTAISNAFFWAISRSQDATFYYDWATKTGNSFGSEYRYIYSADSRGQAKFYITNQPAVLASDGTTVETPAERSYQIDGNANQSLGHGMRLIAQTDYFTNAATQQLYQDILDSSTRDRTFTATLTGGFSRYRFSVNANEADYFYGTTEGQRTGRLPSASLTMSEKPLGHTPIYIGASEESDYIVRQDNIEDPTTNQSLWRFDGGPTIRVPFSNLSFLNATAAANWRLTYWSQSLDPTTGDQVPVSLTRQIVDMNLKFTGPTFERVFQTPHFGYADRFKHVIEPNLTIDHTTPFDQFDRVVTNDTAVDSIVGGDTTITYGISNRLLARVIQPPAPDGTERPPVSRDILDVNLSQSYYTNSLAANFDTQYQSSSLTTTAPAQPNPYSPLSLTVNANPFTSTTGTLRMEFDSEYRVLRTLSAQASVNSKNTQVTVTWSKRTDIPQLADQGFDMPTDYLGGSVRVKGHDNRVGGSYNLNYDLVNKVFLNQQVLVYYNSQCCGINVDWQSASAPLQGVASDHRFAISFTLAGIGSFSNPLGSFGGGR